MISAGVYVVHLVDRPTWLGDALLPPKLLTLSSCLAQMFPGVWALEWVETSETERLLAAEKLGISNSSLPSLVRTMTDAFNAGSFGWPCVWSSADAARSAVRQFQLDTSAFALLQLGVSEEVAAMLIEQLQPRPSEGATGLLDALARQHPVPTDVPTLGWEPLGAEEGGTFHSWLCNNLHDDAFAKLGIRPAAFGLLSTEAEARAVVEMIDSGVGAEPVPWFHGQLLLHQFWDSTGPS